MALATGAYLILIYVLSNIALNSNSISEGIDNVGEALTLLFMFGTVGNYIKKSRRA